MDAVELDAAIQYLMSKRGSNDREVLELIKALHDRVKALET